MTARYPFYELTSRRFEPDGACRRCFQAVDMPGLVLFVWQRADDALVQAQLLLGDDRYVEWHPTAVVSGVTLDSSTSSRGPRAAATSAEDSGAARDRGDLRGRFKGVSTLEPNPDLQKFALDTFALDTFALDTFARARELLMGSDLPAPLVQVLFARLSATASMSLLPGTIIGADAAATPALAGVVSSNARPTPDSR